MQTGLSWKDYWTEGGTTSESTDHWMFLCEEKEKQEGKAAEPRYLLFHKTDSKHCKSLQKDILANNRRTLYAATIYDHKSFDPADSTQLSCFHVLDF